MHAEQIIVEEVAQKISDKKLAKKKVKGRWQGEQITALEFDLSNGKVQFKVGDAKPGEAKLSWTIKRQNKGFFKAGKASDMDIRIVQDGSKLMVEDHWSGKKKTNRPFINMVLDVHPDTVVSGSMGNGTLAIGNHKIAGLSMGNGTLRVNGELAGNASISMGNGSVKGSMLVTGGDHSISMGNGVVKMSVAEGSSFKLNSSVGVGRIKVAGAESVSEKSFLGGSASATIGDGAGTLDISAGNGKISLEVT